MSLTDLQPERRLTRISLEFAILLENDLRLKNLTRRPSHPISGGMAPAYTPHIGDQENFQKIYAIVIPPIFFHPSECISSLSAFPSVNPVSRFANRLDRSWSRFRHQHNRAAFVAKRPANLVGQVFPVLVGEELLAIDE